MRIRVGIAFETLGVKVNVTYNRKKWFSDINLTLE
jgi:hypothetical protein